MTWFIYSILSLCGSILYSLAGRKLVKNAKNPQAFAVIYNGTVALLSPLLFIFDQTLPSNITPKIVLFTLIGLLIWGIFGRYEYFARKNTEASVFTVVADLAPTLNFLLSALILKEQITGYKILGITLIILANIILFVKQKKKSIISLQGLKYSLIVAVFLAFGWLFDTINVPAWGVATFSMVSFIFPSIMSMFFPRLTLSDLRQELALNKFWHIAALGSLNLMGYAFLLKALTLGPATSVVPITGSSTPFIIIFGVIFLGEKEYLGRKLIAALLTVGAIYLMR
jgi:drug/metabolite transporter (DMT)-like permease